MPYCVQNDSGRSEYKFGIRNINHFAKQKTLNSVFFTGLVFSVRNLEHPNVDQFEFYYGPTTALTLPGKQVDLAAPRKRHRT